ncbi:MAG: Calx-beta domain-containing protein, partial [Candidatus Nanopelagicaceae bacterium]
LSTVLGPLQEILALIASPLDIIGNVVAKVLDLLGISCDGPAAKCEKVTKECIDCGTGETEDWLDDLIAAIEDGPLDSSTYVCEEATTTSALESLPGTDVVFVGGTYPPGNENPNDPGLPGDLLISYSSDDIVVTEGEQATFTITRGGNVALPSSLTLTILGGTATQGVDYDKIFAGSSIGFAPGSTTREINFETYVDSSTEGPEEFFIKIEENVTPEGLYATYPGGNVFKCTINDAVDGSISPGTNNDGTVSDGIIVPPTTTTVQPVVLSPSVGTPVLVQPRYTVSTDKIFYKEGETIVYTITAENITNYGPYSYTLDGDIDENDIASGNLTGVFSIAPGTGTGTVQIELAVNDDIEDAIDTELENITFYIDGTPAYASAFILPDDDVLVTNPFWSVSSDVNYLAEGETVTFTVDTLNIPDGTNFTYRLEGSISKTDIVGYRLLSSVDVDANPLQIINGTCEIPLQIASDGQIEEEEYFNFILVSYRDEEGNDIPIQNVSTQVVIQGEIFEDPAVVPTFEVTPNKLTYKEGETIVYTITTTNISNGTVLQYAMYGPGINKSDFDNNSLFGNFTIIDNKAKVYIGIADDTEIENSETVTFSISGTNAFADVIILGVDEDVEAPNIPPQKPCFDKPIAGKPITDGKGSIISIPIVEQGCPYVFPPKVIITGPGYGASGIALLDDKGKVSEVRVTRTGIGYNLNQNPELRCVIDSYTLLSPGRGYTSEPDVYVDGIAGRARAIIDEQGYVISVQPTDRTSTWNEIPIVRLVGGGGTGARVLPSITCLDNKTYEDQGYAKIGTGKYVDCP